MELLINRDVHFNCLLIDINMPDMDGIKLCSLVRSIPTYRTTPINMPTTIIERGFIDRAFKAGATDYANKSFDISEMGAHLRMAEEVSGPRGKPRMVLSRRKGSVAWMCGLLLFSLLRQLYRRAMRSF